MKKYFIITIIFFVSCDSFKIGYPYHSGSVTDSKSKGVFIAEYKLNKNFILYLGDTIRIKEAWLEYSWFYKNIFKQVEKEKFMWLTLTTDIDCELMDCWKMHLFDNPQNPNIGFFGGTHGASYKFYGEVYVAKDTFEVNVFDHQKILFIKK